MIVTVAVRKQEAEESHHHYFCHLYDHLCFHRLDQGSATGHETQRQPGCDNNQLLICRVFVFSDLIRVIISSPNDLCSP